MLNYGTLAYKAMIPICLGEGITAKRDDICLF